MSLALQLDRVSVSLGRGHRRLRVVEDVSLSVGAGEVVALVGESGSGKSVTALAAVRLLGPGARVEQGQVRIDGQPVTGLSDRQMSALRGRRVGVVFQEPMTSLNPLMRIGDQIAEPLIEHLGLTRAAARRRAAELLRAVGFPAADTRLDDYPHQLSGGQRQRVMIAAAIACEPALLIADEPTTALDVTTQAQVLAVLDRLRRDRGMGMLLITHDLGIVQGIADRVAILYAGRIVEDGPAEAVFAAPAHPYTRLLLAALPRVTRKLPQLPAIDGTPPSPHAFPGGCRFHPRCPDAVAECAVSTPVLTGAAGRRVACFRSALPGEVAA